MDRRPLVFGAPTVAFIASMLACNFPARPTRGLTIEAIQLTMDAVTPLATSTTSATPGAGPVATPFRNERPFPITDSPGATFEYETRSGDTLAALAGRFGVDPTQIVSEVSLSAMGYLPVGQSLQIPNVLGAMSPTGDLLPDAELVYSPTASGFDVQDFVALAEGYLSTYQETLDDGSVLSGAAIVQKVADENSVNPRLLLALLEIRNAWVYGFPVDTDAREYPIGFRIPGRSGLYQDLTVAANQLNRGYYGWRAGTLLETTAIDRGTVRWNPTLNAGSVALLHLTVLLSGS
ncbi:MAG: LysM peptidoglycan-binding domain-containing protein, partial [Anaerolineales bacterium]